MAVLHVRHEPSGANFVHLEREDPHLAHGIAFRTPVVDNRGLPHILEHCVLCGSDKYPVRDPFFLMLNRSLASYMNAWTSTEHTFYPFSTENVADFKNLRSVYTDAVFNPLLRESDFQQEAWSFAPSGELKGVVFNEMKGSMSDPDTLFYRQWHKAFYNGTPYAFNNGGDPVDVLKAKHSDLIAFHNDHYRPANSMIVAYGSIDLEEQLKFLDNALSAVARRIKQPYPEPQKLSNILLNIQKRPVFDHGSLVKVPGPASIEGTRTLRSYLLNDTTKDLQKNFDLKILSTLLLDGPAAPLHKALLEEASFGKDFLVGTGYDASATHATFGIGIDGLPQERIGEFKRVLQRTLLSAYEQGFPMERIEGILHQMSLDLRYQSSNFGLNMSAQLVSAWTKGQDVCEALDFPARMRHFEQNDPQSRLKVLLKRHILDNPAYMDFEMHPADSFMDSVQAEEKAQMSVMNPKENVSSEERPVSDKNLLPMLKVEDVGLDLKHPSMPSVKWPSSEQRVVVERFASSTPTCNELVYMRLMGIHDSLPSDKQHLLFLPMALNLLTELGAGELSAEAVDSLSKKLCGSMDVSFMLNRHDGKDDVRLEMSLYALESKATTAVDLLAKCIRECRWNDVDRIKLQLGQAALAARNGIAQSGHRYAALRAASMLQDPLLSAREHTSGLTQIAFLQRALTLPVADFADAANATAAWAVNEARRWRSAVTRDADAELFGENQFARLLDAHVALPSRSIDLPGGVEEGVQDLLRDLNSGYAAHCFQAKAMMNAEHKAAMLLYGTHLKSKVLHRKVREEGGAYGANAAFDPTTQLLTLTSYRDPQPQRSIDLFSQATDFRLIGDSAVNEEDLAEAKLAVMQSWDAPRDVANQGLVRFRTDMEDVMRLELRRALLRMTPSRLHSLLRDDLFTMPWQRAHFVLQSPS